MADPYIKKDPGEIIRAQDWNDIQGKTRDEIHGHLHTGGNQGALLTGAAIDPKSAVKIATLDVAGPTLAAGGIAMAGGDIRLRAPADISHGLGYRANYGATGSGAAMPLDGPVLWGNGGGALGLSSNALALKWDATGVTIPGTLTVRTRVVLAKLDALAARAAKLEAVANFSTPLTMAGQLTAAGGIAMTDADIRLRNAADVNHGLGYRNTFGGTGMDGPLLWGNTGGVLGTADGTASVRWLSSGRVNFEGSSLFFTKTDHNWDGTAATGQASIQNGSDYSALMIVGRTTPAGRRDVKLWDYLQVNGTLEVTGRLTVFSQEPWTNAALIAPWANYGPGWGGAQFMKDSLGFVRLRGLIKSGPPGSNIFSLPGGYRPNVNYLHCTTFGAEASGRIDVYPDGRVYFVNGNNGWVSLDGIVFQAA